MSDVTIDLESINEKALQEHIAEIKSAPAGSAILAANKHLLTSSDSVWPGGGELSLGGFIWWTTSCDLVLTDFYSGVKAVNFSASGTGFMVGGIESEVVGTFIVDPKTIEGSCNFRIITGAVGEGACTLFLYSESVTFYGNFTGPAEGLAAGTTSGSGKLTVS